MPLRDADAPPVAFVGVFAAAADDEIAGEQTPAGFQDTPGQWYAARPRKRGASVDGEATLRDSQATELQSAAPVFVCAAGSLGGENAGFSVASNSAHVLREQEAYEEVDEDETQIIMSLSQDRGVRASGRKIEEQQLEATRLDASHSASDDGDGADSDMSDDMLAHDGPADHISALAATFQRQDADMDAQHKKKAPVPVYRPRTQARHTPTLSVDDDDDDGSSSSSSGAETEVEGEPDNSAGSQDVSAVAERSRARGVARPVARLARARSMSDNSSASEREVDTERREWPRRFRLGGGASNARLRGSERSDSAASDATNVDEDTGAFTRRSTSERSKGAVSAAAASSPVKKKRRGTSDASKTEESSQSSTASAFEQQTVSAAAAAQLGGSSGDRRDSKAKTSARGSAAKTKANTSVAAGVDNSQADRKRRLSGVDPSDAREAIQSPPKEVRIVLTGLEPTPAIRKKIKAIGGAVYEDDVEKATHVVAPKHQLKRTVKLLCGISRCEHIVDEKWLDDSARAGAPLSEQAYCLLDTAAQEKWHFDLHKTMYEFTPAQRRQLFVGHTVFITNHKSVLPPVKDLVKIVECAGGRVEVKGSAGPSDVVITSEAALGVSSVHKSLARANPQRIYSPELILSSILQQHIDFDANHLAMSPATSSQKRSRK